MLNKLAETMLANSLPAERRHAEVKMWEASKLTHIATASRNAITMRFLRWRLEMCQLIAFYDKEVRTSVRANMQSLAWQQPGAAAIRHVGVQFTHARQPMHRRAEAPSHRRAEAVQPQAAASAPSAPLAVSSLSRYIRDNRVALEEQKRMMKANARKKKLMSCLGPLPCQ